ncbi:MarR family winged helix-turn-helix transcriptional regulator [Nocardia bhagyanarayanae]|nr:MarR family transcriptional regulator [Nocardia bhagyanarayanae]
MFIPYRAMEQRVFDALAAAGYADITVAQARLVQRLGPDGTRLTLLAEQAQVTKQTAGFLVDQLERAGYVERVPDPADGRARLVRLTERGEAVTALANRTVAAVEAEWREVLGERTMNQLRRALTKLREHTDPFR